MKKLIFMTLVTASFIACNDQEDRTDTSSADSKMINSDTTVASSVTPDSMGSAAHTATPVTDKDVIDFAQTVNSVGAMEIELGNYTAQHAGSDMVKAFGSMLVNDHTAAGNELKAMATSNSISLPAGMRSTEQAHVDMLEKKNGTSFDKAYIDMMVKGHTETINVFNKAATGLSVQAYKDFANKTLPVLQKHLDSAQAIQKSLK